VLVLSILIMLALAVAVASFFIASAQWLLIASAALVLLAFYLSRRASRAIPDSDQGGEHAPARPARERLTVTVDHEVLESGRHRDHLALPDEHTAADGPRPRPDSGRIAS
jgi:membrane protein implicated in regulation of membrane protease activity